MSIRNLLSRMPENVDEPEQTQRQLLVGLDPDRMLETYESNLMKAQTRATVIQQEIVRLVGELRNTLAVSESMQAAANSLKSTDKLRLQVMEVGDPEMTRALQDFEKTMVGPLTGEEL